MGLFDAIGDFFAYAFCINTTPRKQKTYGREEPKKKDPAKDLSWYDPKKEYPLDYGAFNSSEYIHGYTNAQRQEFRHIWRLAEPFTPYPKTYRFYPEL